MRRALVLGGGGLTGIAWQIGMATGLARRGVDLREADRVIGTSAGSISGVLLGDTRDGVAHLERLYADQSVQVPRVAVAKVPLAAGVGFPMALLASRGDPERLGRVIGRWSQRRADRGRTPGSRVREDEVADRVLGCAWPAALSVVAVEVETGRRRAFTTADGVKLSTALAASCAAPGIYPPVRIGAASYIDGGARSATNADLALGADRTVVLAPFAGGIGPLASPATLLAGHPHLVVAPDRAARRAMGRQPLDPAARPASLQAGLAQAARVADGVRRHWDG